MSMLAMRLLRTYHNIMSILGLSRRKANVLLLIVSIVLIFICGIKFKLIDDLFQHQNQPLQHIENRINSLMSSSLENKLQIMSQKAEPLKPDQLKSFAERENTSVVWYIDFSNKKPRIESYPSNITPSTSIYKAIEDLQKGESFVFVDNLSPNLQKSPQLYEIAAISHPKRGVIVVTPLSRNTLRKIKRGLPEQSSFRLYAVGSEDKAKLVQSSLIQENSTGTISISTLEALEESPQKEVINGQISLTTAIVLKNNMGSSIGAVLISYPQNNFFKFSKKRALYLSVFLFIDLLLLGLLGYFFVKRVILPVQALSEATKAVIQGNLEIRVDSKIAHEDMKKTLDNFNQMVKDLQEKEALKLNFTASLTHDLRTPLLAQSRALDLLGEDLKNQEELYPVCQGLIRNNTHLITMVNTLLETYQFDAALVNLNKQWVNLSSILEQVLDHIRPLAQEKNISITIDSSKISDILADEQALKRVFLNILANSIQNIPPDRLISVSIMMKNSFQKVIIKDNGLGIDPEDLPHIFDRYYTGLSKKRKIGSSLGLFICKQLIEAHQGSIMVASKLGEYTEVTINIPYKSSEALS